MSVKFSSFLRSAAASVALAALAACGSATSRTEGMPAPPESPSGNMAHGDVLTRVQIQRINAGNMMDLIDRHFSGVQVLRIGGVPRLVIRGDSDPLIVVDQNPLADPQELWSLEPNDIESIRILKGTQAALYGSRAGHGVVEITTRIQ